MSAPRAADLPDLSVVATPARVVTKHVVNERSFWTVTGGYGHWVDEDIDHWLSESNAQVLRVGDGSGQ